MEYLVATIMVLVLVVGAGGAIVMISLLWYVTIRDYIRENR